jgi:F-type H+-transporting ATPase subunit b
MFRLALFLGMAASVFSAPFRLPAQQPAPAAAPAQTSAGYTLSSKELDKEEEQGENVYRHSPLVKSTARVLHLQVETTARIYEYINFAVLFLLVAIPLYRFLPRFLRQRSEKLSSDLESARKQTEDANTRLSAVEAKLAKLDEEIAKFRTQVETEMQADEARIRAGIEEESARIVAAAGQEINVAAAQATRELRHFAADLAIEQAARQLVLTPETDRALIAEFISSAGKLSGGRN